MVRLLRKETDKRGWGQVKAMTNADRASACPAFGEAGCSS